ncbi:HupE/UreJ family protein [Luteolibacter arcticus]|uniref:HupE/UreJ family protein n=1 Tax=Luteolibacter arcticus TaxID=1581411 RepID=A0ABT3GI12_9BACT|nr:HupE/UreJ family protein [Luteolibacter arcticus]MCW1923147.1 HupE/UreJ family protein [Luteolibacter arcticus]
MLTLSGWAHVAVIPAATATIQRDGGYAMELTFDVLAFALNKTPEDVTIGPMNDLLDGPEDVLAARLAEAAATFKNEFAVLEDGRSGTVETLAFPSVDDVRRHEKAMTMARLPVLLALTVQGRLPAGARSVSFRLPSKLGMSSLSVVRQDQPVGVLVVDAGVVSSPLPVTLDVAPSAPTPNDPAASPVAEPSRWEWAKRYVGLGFVHIVPKGLDHILFVLGLFLLGNRLGPLLMQVTAFTVAHSITLALSMYGIVRLSLHIVEPLIALSIAFVAAENIFTDKLHRWRLIVVFGFGLIHGLGFASVLTDLGLPRREFATALVSFNLGVEGGQLAVIGLAMLAVGYWRRRPWYRRAIVLPASVVIAAIGLFWAIQRALPYSP